MTTRVQDEVEALEQALVERAQQLKELQHLVRDAEQKLHRIRYYLWPSKVHKADWGEVSRTWRVAQEELKALPERLKELGFPRLPGMAHVISRRAP